MKKFSSEGEIEYFLKKMKFSFTKEYSAFTSSVYLVKKLSTILSVNVIIVETDQDFVSETTISDNSFLSVFVLLTIFLIIPYIFFTDGIRICGSNLK